MNSIIIPKNKYTKTVKVVSVGAGVQSSYLALTENADYYIFADTGDETKETYEFVSDFLIPELKKQGKILTIVKWWQLYNKDQHSMREYYLSINGIPTRKYRSCTHRFKILTIRKFLRKEGVKKAYMLLGITTDEFKRMRDSDVKWCENQFPLIDKNLSRTDLYEWWQQNYEFIPPKSGCYYCPFISSKRFLKYIEDKPIQKELILELEENARKFNSKLILFNKPLIELFQKKVDITDPENECDSGYCFV